MQRSSFYLSEVELSSLCYNYEVELSSKEQVWNTLWEKIYLEEGIKLC